MRPPNRRVLLGAAVAAVLAGAAIVSPDAALGRLEALAADPVAFGLAIAALYLVRPLLAWPPTLCAFAVGYGYGVPGIPVALAGVALTSLPPFFATQWILGETGRGGRNAGAGRGSGTPLDPGESDPAADPGRAGGIGAWVTAGASHAREAGERYFEAAGDLRGTVAARLAPLPCDATTCAAAACGVNARTLVAGTLVGELPWTVAAVLVGASAGRIAGGLGSVGLPLAVASGIGAALLLAGPTYRYLAECAPTPG